MKLQYLGHSACLLETEGATLLFDPFLSGNELCHIDPASVRCDYIILTHGHADHIADAEAIAKANGAILIATFELASYFGERGVEIEPMNLGGGIDLPFGRVTLTPAFHSSSFPGEGGLPVYLGMPAGVLVHADGQCVYHAGDTALFGDMRLIGDMNAIDLALLPIGDRFTMGPREAAKAVEFLRPKHVVPIHYNTFPPIQQDPSAFADAAQLQGVEPHVMQCGDVIEF